jgi:uncharacterized protein (DUF2237 family)
MARDETEQKYAEDGLREAQQELERVSRQTTLGAMTASIAHEINQPLSAMGNDLSTPQQDLGFPGLKPGDRWCLCAPRWQEALEAGKAPRVVLSATHEGALAYCSLANLKRLAIDLA